MQDNHSSPSLDAKEDVRSRLSIEDVIGEYVVLKRAGRSLKGLSPFSGEKTPSFVVSPEKEIWHDFSSNKGGDIFSFIMEVEGLDFRSALELLAQKAGIDLPAYGGGSREATEKKQRLRDINVLAQRYFQQSLLSNQRALDYVFRQRKLSKEVVQNFAIGYAPEAKSALVDFLKKKKYTASDITAAGLTNRFGGDLFRGRMMVPLQDPNGQTIGFTGRIIDQADSDAPKYLNTPQTILYDKSHHVFGLSQAKDSIRKADEAVVVEGNLDVVSSHQVGVTNVVASAGTAMTTSHLKAIKRFSGMVKLAFDGDKAGLAASERVVPMATETDITLDIVSLGGAKDPDELIQGSVDDWKQAIAASVPAVDWIIQQYQQREDLESAVGKSNFITASLQVITRLVDPVQCEFYEQKISKIARVSDTVLQERKREIEKTKSTRTQPKRDTTGSTQSRHDLPTYNHIDTLIGLGFISPAARAEFEQFKGQLLPYDRQKVATVFLQSAHQFNPSAGDITDQLTSPLKNYNDYVKIIIVRAEKRYQHWSEPDRARETVKLLRDYETDYEKSKLEEELHAAHERGDDADTARLHQALYDLIKSTKLANR